MRGKTALARVSKRCERRPLSPAWADCPIPFLNKRKPRTVSGGRGFLFPPSGLSRRRNLDEVVEDEYHRSTRFGGRREIRGVRRYCLRHCGDWRSLWRSGDAHLGDSRMVVNMKALELIDRSPRLRGMVWKVIRTIKWVLLIHAVMPLLIRWWT